MKLIRCAPSDISTVGDHYRLSLSSREERSRAVRDKIESITCPVIVTSAVNPILLHGFRTLEISLKSSRASIPALALFSGDVTREQCWNAVWSIVSRLRYSQLEIAWGFAKYVAATGIEPVAAAAALPDVFEHLNPTDLVDVGRLPRRFLARLNRSGADLKTARIFTAMNPNFRRIFLIVSRMAGHLSHTRMILLKNCLLQLSIPFAERPETMLKSTGARMILLDADLTPEQKGQRILNCFLAKRFPEKTGFTDRFSTLAAHLDLPRNIVLNPPPEFEGNWIDLRLRIKTPADLNQAIGILAGRAAEIIQLLELFEGE